MNLVSLEELKKFNSCEPEAVLMIQRGILDIFGKYKLPIVRRIFKKLLYDYSETNRLLKYLQITRDNIWIEFDEMKITIRTEHFEDTFKIVELPFPHLKYEKYDHFIENFEELLQTYTISRDTSFQGIMDKILRRKLSEAIK